MVIDNFTLYIYQSKLYNTILRCHFTKHICHVAFYQESKKRCFQIGFKGPNLKILKHVDCRFKTLFRDCRKVAWQISNFKYHNPIFGFEVSSSLFQKQLDVCLFVRLLYDWFLTPLKRPLWLSWNFKGRFTLACKW